MEEALLTRIAEALERMAPPPAPQARLIGADAFIWHPTPRPRLAPVRRVSAVDIALLQGVEQQKRLLLENTLRFARGLPANNAMLWGARGMGKSSLVKAAHAQANEEIKGSLALIEIAREDIATLPELLEILREQPRRVLVFCDDLSFEREDADYKALKSVLDGGIAGRPENVVFYATSNRRHLMPRDMIENEQQRAIHASESVEEKVSLSDRFGLWIGFHNCDQPTYFAMVEGYAKALGLPIETEALLARAKEWTITRGSRSGRVAWQFALDMAGELGVKVKA
ncbi:ATP-binding protein [Roseomonas sp. KE2513]|uniref:ATP-binding protein n=1 Tax=Roseomonas sp. KE2513 TaxID=2479202 RepID=UPI0018DF577C|nr:ATP-binding protein [Roseomonas sp. KE2513]MBI0535100.1 ATP-binding protein [Roseomonas sp. KE2513]